MKNTLAILIMFAVIFSAVAANADVNDPCAVMLDSKLKTINVNVEQGHVIDVCLTDPSLQIEKIVIGDPAYWRVVVGNDKNIVYLSPFNSKGGTNALVYLKGDTEARFEIRLRAIKMLKN